MNPQYLLVIVFQSKRKLCELFLSFHRVAGIIWKLFQISWYVFDKYAKRVVPCLVGLVARFLAAVLRRWSNALWCFLNFNFTSLTCKCTRKIFKKHCEDHPLYTIKRKSNYDFIEYFFMKSQDQNHCTSNF